MTRLDMNKASHQVVSVLLNHTYMCFAMFFVLFAFLAWSVGNSPAQEIISAIAMLFYACVVYVKANEIAMYDGKSYTKLNHDIKKPFLWALIIIAITYILYFMFALIWEGGAHAPAWIRGTITFLFNFWTMPYFGIAGAARGQIMWYSHIFFVLVPVLATVLGYISGMKKLYIGKYLKKIVYKNEKQL